MTQDEQRIAIAIACGWKLTDNEHGLLWSDSLKRASLVPGSPMSKIKISQCGDDGVRIPDYLNSLDAMHEAEKTLYTGIEHQRYWQSGYGRYTEILSQVCIRPFSATAAERAEAFLRTIGKWKEAKS